jgi:hypothetical protein
MEVHSRNSVRRVELEDATSVAAVDRDFAESAYRSVQPSAGKRTPRAKPPL